MGSSTIPMVTNILQAETMVFFSEPSVDFCSKLKVIVSGKLTAQHAKSMNFKDGYMISSAKEYIDSVVRLILLRLGVLGVKVKIMLEWDPKGKQGLVAY